MFNPEPRDNRHKTLRRIAIVNAWLAPEDSDARRFSLHANVAFHENPAGGGAESTVYFRLAIRKCEVAVVLPDGGRQFRVDPRTINYTLPARPAMRESKNTHERSRRWSFNFGGAGGVGSGAVDASAGQRTKITVNEVHEIEPLQVLQSQGVDGSPSWVVSTDSGEKLSGSLWDPN